MRCALSVVVLCLTAGYPALAIENQRKTPTLTLSLTFPDRLAVRLGLQLALDSLDRPAAPPFMKSSSCVTVARRNANSTVDALDPKNC
jgi:hypothetical protein